MQGIVKETKFIRSKKEYFIALLKKYCKKRHKQNEGEIFCYYCEEFFYLLEDNDFDASKLDVRDQAKYNRVLNGANIFFIIRHFIPYIKYHKFFKKIELKAE